MTAAETGEVKTKGARRFGVSYVLLAAGLYGVAAAMGGPGADVHSALMRIFMGRLFMLAASGVLVIAAVASAVSPRRKHGIWQYAIAAAIAVAVPFLFCPRMEWVMDAIEKEASQAGTAADFQVWAERCLRDPKYDSHRAVDAADVPAALEPFTKRFGFVSVIRPNPGVPGADDPHVEIVGGGGLSEFHYGVMIGGPGYVPARKDLRYRRWADGVYFFSQ